MDGISLKKPLKLSDLMTGTTFEFSPSAVRNDEDSDDEHLFWNDDEVVDDYKNPCDTSFAQWKVSMDKVADDLFKTIKRIPAEDAKQVKLSCQRVTYHRNMYCEHVEHPFDSTYLNRKPDVICLPMESKGIYLEGFLEALETMKEGEKSLFLISYKKMFKEMGSPPRILPKSDILCELEILKVEDVGEQEAIDKLKDGDKTNFGNIKESLDQVLIRASDYFSQKKIESALKGYSRVYQTAAYCVTSNQEEEEKRKDILKRVHLNMAICHNKLGEYKEALIQIGSLEQLGSIDNQPKVLYAKGVALLKLGELDQAVVPITKALKLKPLDQQIIKAVEELNDRKKTYEGFCQSFGKNLGFQ